jgi:hypothetical protein
MSSTLQAVQTILPFFVLCCIVIAAFCFVAAFLPDYRYTGKHRGVYKFALRGPNEWPNGNKAKATIRWPRIDRDIDLNWGAGVATPSQRELEAHVL